jgi:hypothetical protein
MASAQILTNGKALYAYNGTEWVPLNTTGNLVNSTRWQKVVAGGETSLSGNDDNGESLIYTPGYEQVYLNGVLLARDADYTATTGTTITGLTALTAGYIVEVIAYNNINVGNTYTQGQIDNKIANTFTRWVDTLSASATVLSGLDDNSNTLSYTPGLEQVYVNGILLLPSEYTATSGSSVVLSEAAVSGDVIQIYTLKNFRVPNTYTIGQTDDQFLTKTSASATYIPQSSPVTSFKNKIINSEFDIWQRGTTFSAGGYTADRWLLQVDGSSATRAVSQQALTPGSITGYESPFFLRYNQSVAGSSATFNILDQRIEDVRTLAGQVVTVSFWAKADSSRTITSSIQQVFGTGGSSEVAGLASGNINITTSWTRYSYTGTLASISGKTVGTNSYAAFRINFPINATFTVDIWGVQVERGSIATEFEQRFIGDELRLCQRYLPVIYGKTEFSGYAYSANNAIYSVPFPVTTRVPATGITQLGTIVAFNANSATSVTITFNESGESGGTVLAGFTIPVNQASRLRLDGTTVKLLFTGCEL